MNRIKELLAQIGLEPERVEMFNMSAAMAGEFVERAGEMVARIEAAGPSPLRAGSTAAALVDTESES